MTTAGWPLPLFHVGGRRFCCSVHGMTAVVHELRPGRREWGHRHGGVSHVGRKRMLQHMLEAWDRPTRLRCMLLGSGPARSRCWSLRCPRRAGSADIRADGDVLAADDPGPADATQARSAGKALHGRSAHLSTEPRCAPGEPGEIVARAPGRRATSNRPEASEALRDGWLHTGDLGYLDSEGYLYVLDRRTDLIVSGGENVYPAEIESALQSHPAVLEAGVIGVADERWGQVPHAVVVLRPGAAATADELLEWCAGTSSTTRRPVITFTPSLRATRGELVRE